MSKRSVIRYDPETMECVVVFKSSGDAAANAHYSRQAISDRCNGRIKKSPADDGYEYCWGNDQDSLRKMKKRIIESRIRGGK